MTNVMQQLKNDYDTLTAQGYEVVAVFLQGSQNYGLNDEHSDVDTKVMVMPTLEDLALDKNPASFVQKRENGQMDVKDVRLMNRQFFKMNPTYLELLYTPFYLVNDKYTAYVYTLRDLKQHLFNFDQGRLVSSLVGVLHQEYKNAFKSTPMYVEAVEKFGYEPKAVSHFFRFFHMLETYTSKNELVFKLEETFAVKLLDVKRNGFDTTRNLDPQVAEEYMSELMLKYLQRAKSMEADFKPQSTNTFVEKVANDLLVTLFKSHFKK